MKRLAIFLAALLAAVCCDKPEKTLFVGTYTDGFHVFDYQTGEQLDKAPMPNPSFLAINGDFIYAVSEMPNETARVFAWHWGGDGFDLINSQPTGLPAGGEDPCHVVTDGEILAVSNYSGGTLAIYTLGADGSISPMDSLIVSRTGGPDLSRQDLPHVHCAAFTPDGKHLLFSEFSADAIGQVTVSRFGVSDLKTAAQLPPDFGPRHILFDKSGKHCDVIGELSGDIAVFDWDGASLTMKQVVKADQVDTRGAADIHFSPDGQFLYASLRLQNDGIAIFSVNDDGTLTPAGYQLTGAHPRNFCVTDDEVLVACRDTDCIEFYTRDKKTGLLTDTGRRLNVSKPVVIAVQ